MTKIEMFKNIRTAVADNAEMVEFIDHEIALLEKKSSTPRKPTKTQLENERFKEAIFEFLSVEGIPHTIKEIVTYVEGLSELSNQRVTHLLTALRNEGKVRRTIVKKVPFYEVGKEEGIEEEG